ncbi:(d)CMP kinase [Caldinitratiruptor microaerophilus]|uniref:Cytidylate kinase n=1 Tax=Caldinitratiruptor microaerophilus TaxID=671077 RepID=A0AA35G8H3_9FIRM|nr:(d)CMP kinase [Caldinitratiruptor microaerophilus]BDG60438.1 cytidylate kinase [Caldinitratiruptor microaerophilus]
MIAIDGPAGAGKSTVARLVAARLGYLYVDTGAMYRAVTLKALREGVDPGDAEALARLVRDIDLVLEPGAEGVRVRLDGEDVTAEIRRPEVSRAVSAVAAVPAVRDRMLELQRALARQGGVVMDGRDIGSRVLPWADRKIFITASLAERARRRQRELAEAGVHASLQEVEAEIARRDHLDSTRPHSPLVQVPDAIVIDTTGLTVDEVVTRVLDHCR